MNADAPRLGLTLISRLRLMHGTTEIFLPARPARWLLAALALSPQLRAGRSQLASQFWEDRDEAVARKNLRQALLSLRTALGAAFSDTIQSDRDHIWLDPNCIETDLDAIAASLEAGEVPDALLSNAAVHTLVLQNLEPSGSLFASWLHLRRLDYETRFCDRLNAILATSGDQQLRAAKALLQLDASDENACRILMRAAVRSGATSRALELYARLWDHLDAEYGIEPSGETQALIAEIKMQGDGAGQPMPAKPPAQRPRIRVGRLDLADSAPDAASVLRIFRTELISRLVRFREWEIFDAEFQSGDCDYELRLTGAAIADRVSLIAVLTDVREGQVVWGETSQELSQNWIEFHARIARQIAASCNINVSFARLMRLASRPAENAFDNWLLGQTRMLRFRKDDTDAAMALFERAIQQDARFARGYSSQSQILNIRHLCEPGLFRDAGVINRSLALANQAISIDPADAQAHLCRGWACMHLAEWSHAEVSFDLAERCNPDDPWAVISIALAAAFRGEHEIAAALSNRFEAEGWTNSAINWGYLSNIRFLARDFEGSAVAAENAGAASLNIPAWHAAALAHLGRPKDAATKWRAFEDLIRPLWAGAAPGTDAIREWLLSGFPIRRQAERQALTHGVDRAIAHLSAHAH